MCSACDTHVPPEACWAAEQKGSGLLLQIKDRLNLIIVDRARVGLLADQVKYRWKLGVLNQTEADTWIIVLKQQSRQKVGRCIQVEELGEVNQSVKRRTA